MPAVEVLRPMEEEPADADFEWDPEAHGLRCRSYKSPRLNDGSEPTVQFFLVAIHSVNNNMK